VVDRPTYMSGKTLNRFSRAGLTIGLLCATAVSAPPLSRSVLGQKCYGILVRCGVLKDPRKERVRRIALRNELEMNQARLESEGVAPQDAKTKAYLEYLTALGYDVPLIHRWQATDPQLVYRAVWNPNNKPVTGYHGIRVVPDNYNADYRGHRSWKSFYFLFHQGDLVQLYSNAAKPLIGIVEKYQVPNFGWATEIGGGRLSSKTIPVTFPTIQWVRQPKLFVTHLKFVRYSDKWYPRDEVVIDGKLVLPPEIQAAYDKTP
jgi:hypothetical protein